MRCFSVALVTALLTSGVANADLVNPSVPTWRGDAGSLYYQWDSFTEAFAAPNFPTAPPFEFGSQVFNFAGGAQIVDGGIYSPGGLNVHVYGDGTPTSEVVLNVTYTSFDPSPTSVEAFVGGFGPGAAGEYFDYASSERTSSVFIGEGLFRVNDAYTFDLSSYEGSDTNWATFFKISGPNTLEGVSIDVQNVVPAPGVLAVLGLAGLAGRRRRG